MLGRIVKFRRGDQYEEMKGRDVAGGTAEADKTQTSNVHSSDQPNQLPAGTGNSTAGHQDTTPDGTYSCCILLTSVSMYMMRAVQQPPYPHLRETFYYCANINISVINCSTSRST